MYDLLITLTAHERDSNNVTIALTMGVKAREKGHAAALMLLSDAVALGQKDYADRIDIGAPFEPAGKLLAAFLEQGGKLLVCKSCMVHNGVDEASLIAGSEVITADDVVDILMASNRTLQLN